MSSDALIIWLWQNAKKIGWWTIGLLLSLAIFGYFGSALWTQQHQTVFLPGALTQGHHQFADKCQVCHQPFERDSQTACVGCHAQALEHAADTHNAAKVAHSSKTLDTARCVSCHSEHKPEITQKMGVTRSIDFCVSCHQTTVNTRADHHDFASNSCTQCHNYHDNRALSPSFLKNHRHDAQLAASPKLIQRNFSSYYKQLVKVPLKVLRVMEQDSPPYIALPPKLANEWESTRHAQTGVNCKACHSNSTVSWIEKPDYLVCQDCHQPEKDSFLLGKHGINLTYHLSSNPIKNAYLPMQAEAQHRDLNCNSCHPAHRFDTKQAAIEGCLSCHADSHSLAYKKSPHYQLWIEEQSGNGAVGIGVSCANCHLPRIKDSSRVVIQHNPSTNLRPNHKMLEDVCLQCHGLEFSLDALSDPELVKRNFDTMPKNAWQGWKLLP